MSSSAMNMPTHMVAKASTFCDIVSCGGVHGAGAAFAGAIFGTFMALLDVSVTNASLPQIPGEIGATGTEGTWIGTGSEFALLPPENATGNFTKIVQRVPVRIRIAADDAIRRALRPGLSVEAEVDTK